MKSVRREIKDIRQHMDDLILARVDQRIWCDALNTIFDGVWLANESRINNAIQKDIKQQIWKVIR